jgi:type II secretory pathway pseudopilin PulG
MRTGRATRTGLTVIEVVVVILVVALLAGMLLPKLARQPGVPRRIRCRNNLQQLAKGMQMYLDGLGDGTWYSCPLGRGVRPDDYNGAEWLASLYWTSVVTDPAVFLCPSSPDENDDGWRLGGDRAIGGLFGSQTVSYAGMHYRSLRDGQDKPVPGAIPADYPPNKPMASDDTQGDINHGTLSCGGMSVLFFDSHIEFRTNTEVHLKRAVGDTAPDALLGVLRN